MTRSRLTDTAALFGFTDEDRGAVRIYDIERNCPSLSNLQQQSLLPWRRHTKRKNARTSLREVTMGGGLPGVGRGWQSPRHRHLAIDPPVSSRLPFPCPRSAHSAACLPPPPQTSQHPLTRTLKAIETETRS
ncbi:hypothetical protein J6590_004204 [Homalodisca vitripennis]|nr:hypothetical protein J6590_004204 [Homalodisca vitripennis]